MSDLLGFSNDLFVNFAFYSGLVVGKTLLMGPMTTFFRIKKKVYANEEDIKCFSPGKAVERNDAIVERIRRCHQNDLENVVPFTLIGLLYVSADPDPQIAMRLFRVFAASRLLHTVAYLAPLPQPCRALCFLTGTGATAAMLFFVVCRTTFFK